MRCLSAFWKNMIDVDVDVISLWYARCFLQNWVTSVKLIPDYRQKTYLWHVVKIILGVVTWCVYSLNLCLLSNCLILMFRSVWYIIIVPWRKRSFFTVYVNHASTGLKPNDWVAYIALSTLILSPVSLLSVYPVSVRRGLSRESYFQILNN